MTFADAYGKDCYENPYIVEISTYLPKGYLGKDARKQMDVVAKQTTIDTRTGLMWVKDGKSAGCNYGKPLSWGEATDFCTNLSFAGYSEWRIPTREEMRGIVARDNSIDYTLFPHTKVGIYWASHNNEPWGFGINTIAFNGGNHPMSTWHVRCVRNLVPLGYRD